MARTYYVYILTNRSGTLYVGVTNNLLRRLMEHRKGKAGSFTTRYKMDRLLYFEEGNDVSGALEREKEMKDWSRSRKVALINTLNPKWLDLSEGWFDADRPAESTRSQAYPVYLEGTSAKD